MADSVSHNGNASRVEAAAESALLRLVARTSMAVLVPAGIAFCGWAATEVWASVKKTGEAVNRLEVLITANGGTLQVLNSRLDAQGRRVDQHDTDIERLRERLYALPPRSTP
jgi:hypothetical protein